MTNRRQFLQIGLAASALSSTLPIGVQASSLSGNGQFVPFYKAVFDSRYGHSVKFAEHMRKQEVAVHEIRGDITPFWFKELDALWRDEPVAVAGMTAHGPLFCLERLAWDRGMRVVYRAEHKILSDGIIHHQLSGPSTMLDKSASGNLSLAGLGDNWSAGIGQLMLECPLGQISLDEASIMSPINDQRNDSDDIDAKLDPLISWIIAPAQKVSV